MQAEATRQKKFPPRVEGYYTVHDLCKILGISEQTVWGDIKRGKLQSCHLPIHQGVKNAPHYFPILIGDAYIESRKNPE